MKATSQNSITQQMIDDLYRKECVGQDVFEKKIDELEKEKEKLKTNAEDRLFISMFGTDSEKEEQEKRLSENSDKIFEINEQIDD